MPRTARTACTALLLLTALAGLAGCAGGGAGGSGSDAVASAPAVSATPTPTSMAGVSYPLDAYRQSATQSQTIDKAMGLLMTDCMHRLGFADFTPPQSVATTSAAVKEQQDGPGDFGYLDAARAAQYGFHQPGDPAAAKGSGSGGKESAAELAALTGQARPGSSQAPGANTPPGGCTGEASRALRGTVSTHLSSDLIGQAYDRTMADSRVVAATRRWSACMAKAGFSYGSPGDLATEAWAATPTSTEIATARADVTCTRSSNLAGVAQAVQTAIEQQLIGSHQQQLEAERSAIGAAVRKAEQIIQEHGA